MTLPNHYALTTSFPPSPYVSLPSPSPPCITQSLPAPPLPPSSPPPLLFPPLLPGTLPYMAPELLLPSSNAAEANSHFASRAVDVYSFGLCLWEACTREFPWRTLLQQGKTHELKRRVGRDGERPHTDIAPEVEPASPPEPLHSLQSSPPSLLPYASLPRSLDPSRPPTLPSHPSLPSLPLPLTPSPPLALSSSSLPRSLPLAQLHKCMLHPIRAHAQTFLGLSLKSCHHHPSLPGAPAAAASAAAGVLASNAFRTTHVRSDRLARPRGTFTPS